jgi:hypothetical protein
MSTAPPRKSGDQAPAAMDRLRPSEARNGRKAGACGQMQELSAGKFHCISGFTEGLHDNFLTIAFMTNIFRSAKGCYKVILLHR